MISVRGHDARLGRGPRRRTCCPSASASPVFVDNDANLGALAESAHGASRDLPGLGVRARVVRDRCGDRPRRAGAPRVRRDGRRDRPRAGGPAGRHLPVRQPRVPRHGRRRRRPARAAAVQPRLARAARRHPARDRRRPRLRARDRRRRLDHRRGRLRAWPWPSTRSASWSAASSRRPASCCSARCARRSAHRVLLNQIAPLEVVPAELGQRAEVIGALELVLRSTDFVAARPDDAGARRRASGRTTIDARTRRGFTAGTRAQRGAGEVMSASPRVPLLSLRQISLRFGAVEALVGVDLDVFAHQVVALVGDNGAGKSTLAKVDLRRAHARLRAHRDRRRAGDASRRRRRRTRSASPPCSRTSRCAATST